MPIYNLNTQLFINKIQDKSIDLIIIKSIDNTLIDKLKTKLKINTNIISINFKQISLSQINNLILKNSKKYDTVLNININDNIISYATINTDRKYIENIELEQSISISKYTNRLIAYHNLLLNKLTTIEYIKPIIKWVGGKTQIIDKIIYQFPKIINNYHELFVGGGSVLLALLQNIKKKYIVIKNTINAYDINETLINMYKNIQSNLNQIIIEIKQLINTYLNIKLLSTNQITKPKDITEALTSQEAYYYWIRENFNKLQQIDKNKPLGTAYFIFLNKTCFRGLYREGPNGFNVPFGHYTNPEILNEEHLIKISKLISDVNFYHMNFEESFNNINQSEDNFLYLDPPYAPENNKSFVGYTSNGFNIDQHNKLFTMCKNYKFLMSNSDVDFVKNHFNNIQYKINVISCKRAINSKKPNSITNEILIKSY